MTPPLEYSMGMQWVHCWLQAQHCVIITNTWNKQRHIFSFQNPNDIAKGKGRYGPYSEKCLNVLTPVSLHVIILFSFLPSSTIPLSPHTFQFLSQRATKSHCLFFHCHHPHILPGSPKFCSLSWWKGQDFHVEKWFEKPCFQTKSWMEYSRPMHWENLSEIRKVTTYLGSQVASSALCNTSSVGSI